MINISGIVKELPRAVDRVTVPKLSAQLTEGVSVCSSAASAAARAYALPGLSHSLSEAELLYQSAEKLFGSKLVGLARKCNGKFIDCGEFEIAHGGAVSKVSLSKQVTVTGITKYPSIEVSYAVRDAKGEIAGECNSVINEVLGEKRCVSDHLYTEMYGKGIKGLGSFIEEQTKKEARLAGANEIRLEAAYNSHVFHYKNGYRASLETSGVAKSLLCTIKSKYQQGASNPMIQEFIPEIERILKLTDSAEVIAEANKLLDSILCKAAQNNLRSADIGLRNSSIFMACKL